MRAHQRWPAQAFSVALKTMKKGEEATLEISPACAPCFVHAQRPWGSHAPSGHASHVLGMWRGTVRAPYLAARAAGRTCAALAEQHMRALLRARTACVPCTHVLLGQLGPCLANGACSQVRRMDSAAAKPRMRQPSWRHVGLMDEHAVDMPVERRSHPWS